MRGLRNVGVALAVIAALGSATAAAASAHSFKASKTGELKAKQTEWQIFQTSGGTIECETLNGTGTVSSLTSETQKATVEFGYCAAFSIPATISPVEFEFNANGTVSILKKVTITASGYCKITIPAQSGLSSVKYIDLSGGKIELEPTVKGITSTGSGVACEYGTEHQGDYGGNSIAELVGGTLEWS
ncbi:MAG: hypothetical protein ACYCU0_08930 [Solirubrobacteraceae bacterium]